MKLSRFLTERVEDILVEWEAFAKTLEPAAILMTSAALRDHAKQMIQAIALDIDSDQTEAQRSDKSHGDGPRAFPRSAASVHGTLREGNGFSLVQLTAEFRALRASVLRLWLPRAGPLDDRMHEEVVRFNEAVDQALAESAVTFSEHTDKTRDRFLAILGHDLRNPLSAIGLYGAILERSGADETARIGQRLSRSVAMMSTMVNDLLEYSRTQLGGKMPMAPASADMRDIYLAALHDAQGAHPECPFETTVAGDTSGMFDSVRHQQVIANLLSNAAQYRAQGTPVQLTVEGVHGHVSICVRNQGPAIPPDALRTIFSAMVQLPVEGEQPGRPRTSMGLGLFIARETSLAHGGSIDVSSSDQDGTVFTVRIPRELRAPIAQ